MTTQGSSWTRATQSPHGRLAVVLVALAALVGVVVSGAASDTTAPKNEAAPATPEPIAPTRVHPAGLVAVDPDQAMAIARATGNSVEVISAREAAAEEFATPDGRWLRREWLAPKWVHVSGTGDAEQDWTLLDPTLARTSGGAIAPNAYPTDLTFSDGSVEGAALVSWSVPESNVVVEILAPVSPMPAPVLEGARIRYPGIAPGLDMVFDVLATGFEQYFVVHDLEALSAHGGALTVDFRVHSGQIVATEHALEIHDDAGNLVGVMPTPVAWDAAQDPFVPTPVLAQWAIQGENPAAIVGGQVPDTVPLSWHVAESDSSIAVVVEVPLEWAGAADRSFPLVVDPTFQNPLFGSDMYVRNDYPDYNYSSEIELRLGKDPTYGAIYRPLLAMDTTAMKPRDITDAWVGLWNYWSATCSQVHWHAYWTTPPTGSSTWNNQPILRSGAATSTQTAGHTSGSAPNCLGDWVYIDITSFVASWKYDVANTQGIMLVTGDESNTARWKRFYSLETSSAYKPRIDYYYNKAPAQPTDFTYTQTTETGKVTLRAKVTDPDLPTTGLYAAFTIERAPIGTQLWELMIDRVEGSSVANNQYSERSLDLIAGYRYRVKAWGYDGRIYSTTATTSYEFDVDPQSNFVDLPTTGDTGVNDAS